MSYFPRLVKSLQYGTCTIPDSQLTGTATLGTTVNTAKSVLHYLGSRPTSTGLFNFDVSTGFITLTNSTTVTGTRTAGLAGGTTVIISYVVVEYY